MEPKSRKKARDMIAKDLGMSIDNNDRDLLSSDSE
jgi:hypothetical protein